LANKLSEEERLESGLDLAEVFQYDGDVHVDNDQKCDDQVSDEEQYSHSDVATVAVRFDLGGCTVTVRWFNH